MQRKLISLHISIYMRKRKYSFLHKRSKIFITIVSASSIKKISLSNSDTNSSDVTFKKNYTASKIHPTRFHHQSRNLQKRYPRFLSSSPCVPRISTRTLFDSITVKNHHPGFLGWWSKNRMRRASNGKESSWWKTAIERPLCPRTGIKHGIVYKYPQCTVTEPDKASISDDYAVNFTVGPRQTEDILSPG